MIVPMQKVVIIGPPSKGMAIVRRLGALGVVHLEPVRSSHKDGTNDALEAARQAMKLLDEGQVPASSVDVERAIQQTNAAHVRREQAQTELLELQCEAERIAPLGEFDPGAFAELASGGIHSQLFTCTRGVLPEIRAMHLPFAEVGHAGKTRYVVLFRMPTKGLPSGLVPVALPECSLSQIQARIADRVAEIANADAELAELSASRPEIVAEIASMEDEEACLGVVDSMADQAPFVTCCGFCPEDQVVAVRAAIGELGGGLLAVPPGDCDEPPTLLKNAKLAASAEPIYRLIDTVPGYREMDVSFWFLLYLSAFFAILVGDAGYGLLLLAGVGIWHRTRGVPPPIFRLCFILGGVTVVWGALSGNWFGSRTLAELPLLAAVVVPDLDVFSVASQQQVMYLSFVLGASHLAVAHGLAAWRVGHALAMVGHLGWLLVLAGAFFLVRFLVLEMPMPGFARWSIGVGAVIAVCCGQPRKGLLATVLAGLGNFPLKAMACFSDLISYIRLFAVGMATFAVAASFNDIASAMYGGRVIMAGIGLLVLILGHTTNILMAGLSVVVHGVRLNLLEFSGHADMQWSGEPYRPFRLSQTHTHK